MSDKKKIIGTREKKKEFAILPPQLQRIIYLTKYLSVFCFSILSSALFSGCAPQYLSLYQRLSACSEKDFLPANP